MEKLIIISGLFFCTDYPIGLIWTHYYLNAKKKYFIELITNFRLKKRVHTIC